MKRRLISRQFRLISTRDRHPCRPWISSCVIWTGTPETVAKRSTISNTRSSRKQQKSLRGRSALLTPRICFLAMNLERPVAVAESSTPRPGLRRLRPSHRSYLVAARRASAFRSLDDGSAEDLNAATGGCGGVLDATAGASKTPPQPPILFGCGPGRSAFRSLDDGSAEDLNAEGRGDERTRS